MCVCGVCIVAVYQRPLVLQPNLPTYVCSFASPCVAAAATNVPSSEMLRSPVPNVLWSQSIVTTQEARVRCSASSSVSELTVPTSHITSVDCRPTVEPHHMTCTSSHQPVDCVSRIASQLVASLPADSAEHTANMLVDALNAVRNGNIDAVDTAALQNLCSSPQLASIVKELFYFLRTEPEIQPTIGRWKSLPGLLQQSENITTGTPFSHPHGEFDVDDCQDAMRCLQVDQAPEHQLVDDASDLYWYVFFSKVFTYWNMLYFVPVLGSMLIP